MEKTSFVKCYFIDVLYTLFTSIKLYSYFSPVGFQTLAVTENEFGEVVALILNATGPFPDAPVNVLLTFINGTAEGLLQHNYMDHSDLSNNYIYFILVLNSHFTAHCKNGTLACDVDFLSDNTIT